MIRIGLVGKTNTGKTTFFNAATLASAEVSNYPFTTRRPSTGNTDAITICVHREFDIQDNPKNSRCVNGWRYIPIELIDLPGLIKGAWEGKGLGNQFLAVAAQSDALIHIVDVSGGIDATGRIAQPGTGDPIADVGDIEEELAMWYLKLIEGNRDRISRAIRTGTDSIRAVADVLGGIGVKEEHVRLAMNNNSMVSVEFDGYTAEKIKSFAWSLRVISKPTLILGNKIDLPFSAYNFKRLRERYKDFLVIPASADAELTLRRAVSRGLIGYNPGDERFEINNDEQLNDKQKWALNFIRRDILGEYLRTGVQFAINVAVFKLLSMNTVYPVADPKKLSDKHGNILPDVYLMNSGSTIEDLARTVHTDLAEGILYGVDARDGLHLPRNYIIKDRDILSIVSGKKRRKSATRSERR